jgi:inhibitor of cysteine peptidase
MNLGFSWKTLFTSTCAILLAVAMAARAQSATPDQKKQHAGERMVITGNRNGQTVNVRVGDEVVIQLPAQMGTGYSWQLRTREAKIAVPQGEPELKSTPGQAPGAPEQQLFRFKIQAPGSTTIQLQYVRPWEKNQPPQKTFQVTLHAQ